MADEVVQNDPGRFWMAPVGRLSELISRVSWGAIWAGVMVALGMEALFTLFGLFIGFNMYNAQAANPWAGVPAWSLAWYLVTAAWSMYFGAWCAARFSGNPVREAAILHGITTWGLATVATVLVVTAASWAALREGIDVLRSAAMTAPAVSSQIANGVTHATQQAAQAAQNPGPAAQATANIISGLALRIWGGVLLGFITAIFGGWAGRTRTVVVEQRTATSGPSRLAA